MNGKGRWVRTLATVLVFTLVWGLLVPMGASAIYAPPPTPSITGVVTDTATGAPVAGVTVWLEKGGGITPACFSSATTDAEGRYTFSGVPSGYNYWIVIGEPEGYQSYESAEFPYTGTLVEHDVVLEPVAVLVSGTVTVAGEPAEGVKVKLWRLTDGGCEEWVDYLWTEADGRYTLYADTDQPGTYFIRLYDADYELIHQTDQFLFDGTTPVVLDIDLAEGPERLADDTRFSTSVEIGRSAFDPAGDGSWPGVTSVVIASGDDRFSADPLSAAGLCGSLDAPLFLISSTQVPWEVKAAIKEIVAANGPIDVYVVGGEVSVPQARLADLAAFVGDGKLTFQRIAGVDRYDTAACVAKAIIAASGAPEVVLVANGARTASFFDALALAPVAAAKGYPVLLVSGGVVPRATQRVLDSVAGERVIVAGGPSAVPDAVLGALSAERWSGANRYETAVAIASNAESERWLDPTLVGVAAKLPDALSGGGMCGKAGGVLLLTDGANLSGATRTWLEEHDQQVTSCVVFGGEASVREDVRGQIGAALALDIAEQ